MIGETPASGASGVAVSATATATFNQAVVAGTIDFTLENSSGVAVGATVAYNPTTDTATLTPELGPGLRTQPTRPRSAVLRTRRRELMPSAVHLVVHHGPRGSQGHE